MEPIRETYAVFAHELRRSVRSSKTLVLLILYSLATVLSGLVFLAATRAVQENFSKITQGKEIPPEVMTELKMGGLSLFYGKENEALLRYLADIPLIVVFFFKFALFFLPLLILLMGFDQISGELQSRSLRFVALRTRRGSVLAGKLVAQAAVLIGLTALINVGLFIYAALTTENFAVGPGVLAMFKFWALALVYAASWLGLTSLCSSMFKTPIYSLLTGFCIMFGFWLLSLFARFVEKVHFLAWLTPSHYEDNLISPHPLQTLGSVGAYAAFAAVFLGLAYLSLRARDL